MIRLLSSKPDEKLKWAKTLKPGDVVNDCRYLNMRIVSIVPRLITERTAGKSWGPEKIGDPYNFDATFEDGNICSIMNCAEPAIPQTELEAQIKEYHPDEAEEILKNIRANKFHVVI
jgi:hypothetical protein